VIGVYEAFFTALSGDVTLQTLLGGSATDKKIYPIATTGPSELPAIQIAVVAGSSDLGFNIDRPVVDVLISSLNSATELNNIGNAVDAVLNRERLSGPNGAVLHVVRKIAQRDDYNPNVLEYRRVIRYIVVKT
jgi:hypothetical protein